MNGELRGALEEVRTLSGLLPMCCFHTAARISHPFCPECAARHFPEEPER